jgi:hypothetical protein
VSASSPNNILALAKDPSVDADVIVSSDHHLIDLGPAWNGRLMMRPRSSRPTSCARASSARWRSPGLLRRHPRHQIGLLQRRSSRSARRVHSLSCATCTSIDSDSPSLLIPTHQPGAFSVECMAYSSACGRPRT